MHGHISLLDVMGLHACDIDHAWQTTEDALKSVFLADFADEISDKFCETAPAAIDWDIPTDSLICHLFEITGELISDRYPSVGVSFYVNGYDSHFYVDDGNRFAVLKNVCKLDGNTIRKIMSCTEFANLPEPYFVTLASNSSVREDVLEAFRAGNDYELYNSVADLGKDNSDSDLYDAEDTDESFGAFLIRAYKDGNSRTIYLDMPDGNVFAMPMAV